MPEDDVPAHAGRPAVRLSVGAAPEDGRSTLIERIAGHDGIAVVNAAGRVDNPEDTAKDAAQADVSVIMVDARSGLTAHTKQVAACACMTGVRHLVLAVNKLDLVGWDQHAFQTIAEAFRTFTAHLGPATTTAVPVSALAGENIETPSAHTTWYDGPPLIALLRAIDLDPDRAARLCAALDAFLTEQNVPGGVVGARSADGATHVCAGGNAVVAGSDPVLDPARPMTTTDRFRIGSVSKTFTAAAILLLRDDGVLTLDDPLSRWVPGFGTDPTLAEVLNHTSGLGEYLFEDVVQSERTRVWTDAELLDVARSKPPTDAIGARFRYSNTNYLVAGAVITAASGMPWPEFLRTRLIDPHGLDDTFVAGYETVEGGRAEGYDVTGDAPVEVASTFHQTVASGAGAMVSDGDDLLRWAHALYSGEVFSADGLRDMNVTFRVPHAHDDGIYEGSFVSLGNFIGTDDEFGDVYGHAGGTQGFSSNMRYLERDGIAQVLLINATITSEQENALRGALWEALLL